MLASDPPIITTQDFKVSKVELWNAITNPEEMKKWYFEIMPDFKPEVGFKTQFLISVEDRNYTHLWEVTDMILQEMIKTRWHYEEHPGDSYVIFEIIEIEGGTRLKATCEITEDFPQDLPEFKRDSGVAGWKFLIQDRLVNHLAKKESGV